jgi:hypothetical protein
MINPWADFLIGMACAYTVVDLARKIISLRPSLKIKIKRNKIDK